MPLCLFSSVNDNYGVTRLRKEFVQLKSDDFHFQHCSRLGYTLVSFDTDFNDDTAFPFSNGQLHGVIVLKGAKRNSDRKQELSAFLAFVLKTPLPKDFLRESKFVMSNEGCVMRGRDIKTKEIKSLHIASGKTRLGEVWKHFSII